MALPRTILTFHTSSAHTLRTVVTAVHPFTALEEANRALFKQGTEEDHVVITEATIFHPQGGGQPSDEGTMTAISSTSTPNDESTIVPPSSEVKPESETKFTVLSARMSNTTDGQVLHLGRFTSSSHIFTPGTPILQTLDSTKRHLYSRLHTAGHVLGAAVRHLLQDSVPDFDELKASHFPDSAACEFQGLIDGKHKAAIQARVDEYVEKDMPVEVEWWDYEEFKANGVPAPERGLGGTGEGEKYRVVRIRGCEVYPCGGTHVESTSKCGKTTVRKIARSKGTSRVSYAVQ